LTRDLDAVDMQEKFGSDVSDVIDSIPTTGHAKGGLHYALGQNEKGDIVMKSASRTAAAAVVNYKYLVQRRGIKMMDLFNQTDGLS
jgi:hypothetical protein